MSIAIEGIGLEKTFKKKRSLGELVLRPFGQAQRVHALRGVDLQIERGEIFGLLGPNGAGKTTLLKILSCLVLPDRGQALIDGLDTEREYEVKRRIGLVNTDERSFYWRLSGRENLNFFARLYDVPSRRMKARVDELLSRVDLQEAADRPFSDYSSGMKQRVAIARALLHDPPILLMDEPTRSLDPASALDLRNFILSELRGRDGKTILIASHNLREVEAMADRIAILIQGKVRHIGTVEEVRKWGIEDRRFRLELPDASPVPDGPFRVLSDAPIDGVRTVTIALRDGVELHDVLRVLLDAGLAPLACDRVESDLEQAFTRILASSREQA